MVSLFLFVFTIYCINLLISGFELINLIVFLESLNILFILFSGLKLIGSNPLLWVYFIATATIGVVFILCLLSRLWFCDNFFL
uniref:NADH dehydrogenase subunit 4L n=1 Tax=Gyrodactylus salaris TaxID=37629 RepID=A2D6E4_GYRSA|nr:NADH dehydrogenase subunit 4L [Gyrodactylus salaris]ABI74680.1 NADH dehydrogenase subunit 4L [Gyrodactylus salaris]ABO86168.1 NADH dehydrogenase subunit 4L [Gyrodactylus salaris]